jgi:tRNA-splicing ligase RtcB
MSDIKVYGEHEPKTLAQMQRCMTVGSAVKGVLCADGHLGYAHPIGGVVAYEEDISISGVGFDIACGNMAVRLDARFADLAPRAKTILDDIGRSISFGVGQRNAVKVDHDLFDSALWNAAGVANLKEMARLQLGTVGSGNHYVDLFEDEEGLVWIGVHFGSRGLGHKITTKHLEWAGAKDGMEVDPAVVPVDSDIGQSYIAGIKLGGLYAYAGREWVVERVRQIIGAAVTDSVSQPPQLRLARDARRPRSVGRPQRRYACFPGPARLRRRLDGRRCGDPRRHRERGVGRQPLLDGAWCGPHLRAHRGEGQKEQGRRMDEAAPLHAQADGRLAAGEARASPRRRRRRESHGLSPAARRATRA